MRRSILPALWLAAVLLPIHRPACADALRIAVLDFDNLTQERQYDQFRVGIPEILTAQLQQVPTVRVVERRRVADVLAEQKLDQSGLVDTATAAKIGAMVGAGKLLLGSIQVFQGEMRIQARLVDSTTAEVSTAAVVRDKVERAFDLQDRLAVEVCKALGVPLTNEAMQQVSSANTQDAAAYQSFVEGTKALREARTEADYAAADKAFGKAVQADPKFALAAQQQQYVRWARPNLNTSTYLASVAQPFDRVFDAVVRGIERYKSIRVKSADRATGTIVAKQEMDFFSRGQEIRIEMKPLGPRSTGVRIDAKARQVIDWGRAPRSIRMILDGFNAELQSAP